MKGIVIFVFLSACLVSAAWAQSTTTAVAQGKQAKVLNVEPMRYVDPLSPASMYQSYCAACHGRSGKGDGAAAEFLKTMPADLTLLARNNHGKFPTMKVRGTLLFGKSGPAHGTVDMPEWGSMFKSREANVAQLRVDNLVGYLRTLQEN